MSWRKFSQSRRKNSLLFVSLFAALIGSAALAGDSENPFATDQEKIAAAKTRTWTAGNGKFTVEAKLVKIDEGKVVLKRNDGQEISVPLEKLSEADQKYVDNLLGKTSPAAGENIGANSSGVGGDAVGDSKVVYKLTLIPTDYRNAKPVDLSGAGSWKYTPDPAAAAEKLPAVRIPLKPVDIGDYLQRVLLLPKEKKAFVVFYNQFKTHASQVQACNLRSGQMDGAAVFGEDETPIDISPDGTLVLAKLEGHETSRRSELHLYTREGSKVKPLKGWRPYSVPAASDENRFDTEVSWAAFTDSQHILTNSTFGKLVLWELPSLKPVWGTTVASGHALSPGRQYLVVLTSPTVSHGGNGSLGQAIGKAAPAAGNPTSGISILNIADGAEVGHIQLDDAAPNGSVGISPDGTRLALGQSGRMRVWDLQTQVLIRDFAVQRGENPLGSVEANWTSNQHLLVGDGILVDVDRRAPIWKYNFTPSAVLEGKVWFLEQSRGVREGSVLVSMEVPHPAALASVANLKPEDLVVLHPGMEVALDCQLTGNAEEVDAAKKNLEERLKKNGMKLVSESKTRLIATVQSGKSVTIYYRPHSRFPVPFNRDPGTPYQTTIQVLSLRLEIDGKAVWKYETSTSPPSLLQLKEGETVEQALERSMKSQEDYLPKRCTTVWIPAYIARVPGDDGNINAAPGGNQKPRINPTRGRET